MYVYVNVWETFWKITQQTKKDRIPITEKSELRVFVTGN